MCSSFAVQYATASNSVSGSHYPWRCFAQLCSGIRGASKNNMDEFLATFTSLILLQGLQAAVLLVLCVLSLLSMLSLEERAERHPNEVARHLLQRMASKKSNLCVSVDVTDKASFLRIVDAVGPYVCLIKVRLLRIFKAFGTILKHQHSLRRTLIFWLTLRKTSLPNCRSSAQNMTFSSLRTGNLQT